MKQDRNIKKETGKKKPAARKQSWSLDEKFEEWVGEKPARGAGEKKGAKPGKKGRQESVQEFGRENDRKSERKFVQKNTGKFVGKNDKSFGRDADSKQKS